MPLWLLLPLGLIFHGLPSLLFGLLVIIAGRTHPMASVSSTTSPLGLHMVSRVSSELSWYEPAPHTAHLKHGVNRAVILDIDLHHGTYARCQLICFNDRENRQWDAVDRLADQ